MTRRIFSLLLTALFLIPGWSFAKSPKPMGRYVETTVTLPEGVDYVVKAYSDADGRMKMLGSTKTGIAAYVYGDDGIWAEENVPRMLMPNGVNDIAPIEGGAILRYYDQEITVEIVREMEANGETISSVLGRYEDGQLIPINADTSGLDPDKIGVTTSGILLVQSYRDCIVAFDSETGTFIKRYDGLSGAFVTQGETLFAVSETNQSVMQYDLSKGQLINEMKNAPITDNDVLAFDGQALYLANADGLFRIIPGGSIWERLVDGDLTSLRLPEITLDGMAVYNGEIFISAYDENRSMLYRYRYDADVSTLPQYEIRIYTMYENSTLSLAAVQFQNQNPEYLVNISVLLADGAGITENEAVRALNTELLAGAGPDVLLLDGMPISDYIEKGILYDLNPLISELNHAGELVSSVFDPLQENGKMYFAPTSCTLPVALLSDESASHPETLGDLVEMICASTASAPIAWRTKQGYFNMLFPASYPAWFDESGALKEDVFRQFLEAIDAIDLRMQTEGDAASERQDYQTMVNLLDENGGVMKGTEAFPYDLVLLQNGNSILSPMLLGSFNSDMLELTMLNEMSGTLMRLPGQAERVYLPKGLLGVNARSGQLDAAVSFIRVALSQSVQDADLYEGLPVNQKSLNRSVEKDAGSSVISRGYMDMKTFMPMILFGEWPVRTLREQVRDLLSESLTPCIPDNTLLDLMESELESYFAGKMDAQTAAGQVAERVRAYLAE